MEFQTANKPGATKAAVRSAHGRTWQTLWCNRGLTFLVHLGVDPVRGQYAVRKAVAGMSRRRLLRVWKALSTSRYRADAARR